MDRSLLDGKVQIELVLNGKKFTTTQLGVKKGAKLIEYMGGVLSFVYERFRAEKDSNKTMISFALGILPELVVKFVDQMCLAISSSVTKESGELITLAEAEELSFPDMIQLATAVILANADQIRKMIELLTGDIKKKILEAFPELNKYLAPEASPEVTTPEPNLTQISSTISSNEGSDTALPK